MKLSASASERVQALDRVVATLSLRTFRTVGMRSATTAARDLDDACPGVAYPTVDCASTRQAWLEDESTCQRESR